MGIVLFCCVPAGAGTPYQDNPHKLSDPNNWLELAGSPRGWAANFIMTSDINMSGRTLQSWENDTNGMQTQLSFTDFGLDFIVVTGNSEIQTSQKPTSGHPKRQQYPLPQNTSFDSNIDTIELGRLSEEWLLEDKDVYGFCFKNDFNGGSFVGLIDFTLLGSSWMSEIAVP
jgi:hypothetical protein